MTYGRCIIADLEGIVDESGTPIITQLTESVERDAHGNVQLSGQMWAISWLISCVINLRSARAQRCYGYLQRSFSVSFRMLTSVKLLK